MSTMRMDHQSKQKRPDIINPFLFLAKAQALCILASLGVGLSVFWGLHGDLQEVGGLEALLIPVCVATVLTLMLAGSWHFLLAFAVKARRPLTMALVVLLGMGFTGIMLRSSAPYLASAVSGDRAVRIHQELFANELKSEADRLAENADGQRRLKALADQTEARLVALYEGEIRNGLVSGRPGNGPVAQRVAAALSAFRREREGLSDDFSAQGANLADVRRYIELARRAAVSGDYEQFTSATNSATAALAQARSLSGGAILSANSLTGSDIPQVAALGQRLAERVGSANGTAITTPLPVYEPIQRSEAVVRYHERVPLAWAVAICVDLLPFAILLVLMVGAHMHRDEGPGDDEPGGGSEDADEADVLAFMNRKK